MTWIDIFLSPLLTAVFIGFFVFLSRNLILTRLKASVQHEFDAKLELLRADLRKSEESFKGDLRTKAAQIEALQSGALSGLVSRQALVDKRRFEAIEQLWDSIEKLAPFKAASSMMASFDFTKASNLAAQDRQVQEFFSTLGKTFVPENIAKLDAHKSRLFVSDLAWALFAAYQGIVFHAVAQVQMLKVGLKDASLLDLEYVPRLVKVALPWSADYIDKWGSAGYYNMLEPIEAELMKELRRMMRGEESDKASVEQAAKIMEVVGVKIERPPETGGNRV